MGGGLFGCVAAQLGQIVMVQPQLFGQRRVVQKVRVHEQAVQPQTLAAQVRGQHRIVHLCGVRQQRTQILCALGMEHAQRAVVRSSVVAHKGQQRAIAVRQDFQTIFQTIQLFVNRVGRVSCDTVPQGSDRLLAEQLVDALKRVQSGQAGSGVAAVFNMKCGRNDDNRRVTQAGACQQLAQGVLIDLRKESIRHLYPPKYFCFSFREYKVMR